MVFAINSDLFLTEFDSQIIKWSLDQGQKTRNSLIRRLKSLSQGPPQWSPNFDPKLGCHHVESKIPQMRAVAVASKGPFFD